MVMGLTAKSGRMATVGLAVAFGRLGVDAVVVTVAVVDDAVDGADIASASMGAAKAWAAGALMAVFMSVWISVTVRARL